MHRIDTPTAQQDKFGQGKNGFTDGDPATGCGPTDLNSDMWDALQEEICRVIEGSGLRLDKTQYDQLYQAVKKLSEAEANKAKIALVDSAPIDLNTLNKLSKALGNDPRFAETMTHQLSQKVNKSSVLQTTGGATDKVMSQKACTESFAKIRSQDPFEAGSVNIINNYSSLSLTNYDLDKVVLETNPDGDCYLVYRNERNVNNGLLSFPKGRNGMVALTSNVEAINNYPVGAPIPWP